MVKNIAFLILILILTGCESNKKVAGSDASVDRARTERYDEMPQNYELEFNER